MLKSPYNMGTGESFDEAGDSFEEDDDGLSPSVGAPTIAQLGSSSSSSTTLPYGDYDPGGLSDAQLAAAINNGTITSLPGAYSLAQLQADPNYNSQSAADYQGNVTANMIDFNGVPLSQLGDLSAGTNSLGGQLLGSGYINPGLTVDGKPISNAQQNSAYWNLSSSTAPSDAGGILGGIALAAIGVMTGGFGLMAAAGLDAGAAGAVGAAAADAAATDVGVVGAGELTAGAAADAAASTASIASMGLGDAAIGGAASDAGLDAGLAGLTSDSGIAGGTGGAISEGSSAAGDLGSLGSTASNLGSSASSASSSDIGGESIGGGDFNDATGTYTSPTGQTTQVGAAANQVYGTGVTPSGGGDFNDATGTYTSPTGETTQVGDTAEQVYGTGVMPSSGLGSSSLPNLGLPGSSSVTSSSGGTGSGSGTSALGSLGSLLGSLGSVASADYIQNLLSNASSTAQNYTNMYNTEISNLNNGLLNPFASDRAQYATQLNNLEANPSSITSNPGYQFSLNQGEQALQRSAAAQGQLGSGATGVAIQNYAQLYAAKALQTQEQNLAQLSGANFSPTAINPSSAGNPGGMMLSAASAQGSNLNNLLAGLGSSAGTSGSALNSLLGGTSNITGSLGNGISSLLGGNGSAFPGVGAPGYAVNASGLSSIPTVTAGELTSGSAAAAQQSVSYLASLGLGDASILEEIRPGSGNGITAAPTNISATPIVSPVAAPVSAPSGLGLDAYGTAGSPLTMELDNPNDYTTTSQAGGQLVINAPNGGTTTVNAATYAANPWAYDQAAAATGPNFNGWFNSGPPTLGVLGNSPTGK